MAADVVGYSRLMAADEDGTLTALKQFRETLFNPAVASHNGRIVKLIGDGTLVEFASVVDAVECAVNVQNTVANRILPPGAPAIHLRIGVNLGDVIIDGDDIYGDGVNVAARLEPLAEPGGVCISSIVHEGVGNRIDNSFRDCGQVQVKNIDRPISIWKWRPGDALVPTPVKKPERETRSDAPSIAVLPFDNMSGDPAKDYFSDGVAEDIITDLAKVAGLMVIARNSSFSYRGRKFDIRDVARELNVRFVLEGSMRHAGNRVRVTAQLIDAATGAHLWAERYDRDLTDVFAVQDDLTQRIVSALKVTLSPAEKARLADGAPANADARECYIRARELLLGPTQNRETFEEAVTLLNRAITLDPNYAQAYAGLAWVYVLDYTNQWSADAERALGIAASYAERAVEKDPSEPLAYFVRAMVAGRQGEFERAVKDANAALALSPNYAPARGLLASFELFAGRPLEAIEQMERNARLDPVVSQQGLQFLGLAYLAAGKYETAAAIFKQRLVLAPKSDSARALLASALGHMGEIDEARRVWDELKAINPSYSFAGHMSRLPFKQEGEVRGFAEGLTKAGLPTD